MKSELLEKIQEIQEQITSLDEIINEGNEKLNNGQRISKMLSISIRDAKEEKIQLLNELAELKNFQKYTLKLEESNELFKTNPTIENFNCLTEDFDNSYDNHNETIKKELGIKSDEIIDELKDKLKEKINTLTVDLVKYITETDDDNINKTKAELEKAGNMLLDINMKDDSIYNETLDIIDNVIDNELLTDNDVKGITENVDRIIENEMIELGLHDTQENSEKNIMDDDNIDNFKEKDDNLIQKIKNKINNSKLAKQTEEELEEKNEIEEKQHINLNKIIKGAIVASSIIILLAVATHLFKNNEKDNNKDTEPKYDKASFLYFADNRGFKEDDSIQLAVNSKCIVDLLEDNNVNDIKTNEIDMLLADIYDGHNITSSAENYDSLDTLTSLENAASVDIYNNINNTNDYGSIDVNQCANLLDSATYFDINDNSKFDIYLTELVTATAKYYKDLNNDEIAQNLIDTIYRINKEDGFLNAKEEGIITEYIMAVDGVLLINRGAMHVTGHENISVTTLFNKLVDKIEIIENDCTYTRKLN